MSAVEAIALVTGAIGYVLGWLSHDFAEDAKETHALLAATEILEIVLERNHV